MEVKENENSIKSSVRAQPLMSQGVGGMWPSSNASKPKESVSPPPPTLSSANSTTNSAKPLVRPAFYISPAKTTNVMIRVRNYRLSDIGEVMDTIVSKSGFVVTNVQMIENDDEVQIFASGEGGVSVLRKLNLDVSLVTADESALSSSIGILPDETEAAIAVGCGPPPAVNPLFKSDLNDVVVVVITPDSFSRDFTDVDVPLGSIASMLLQPFSASDTHSKFGSYGSQPDVKLKSSNIKCVHDSKLLGTKFFSEFPSSLSTSVARNCVKNENERKELSVLFATGGPCLVLVLTGKNGYAVSIFSHIFQSHFNSKVFSPKHFTNIIISLHLIFQK